MTGDAALELGLRFDRERDALWASLRFEMDGSQVDEWGQPDAPLALDLQRLRKLSPYDEAYGTALTEMVLRPADVGPFYRSAIEKSQAASLPLHVRLHVTAPARYHAVSWETLRDPKTGNRIALEAGVLMSRYLSSPNWQPIQAHQQHKLKALIVVAGPADIEQYAPGGRALLAVDVDAEVARAREALTGLQIVSPLTHERAGLEPMLRTLEKERADVLYLVCHGALIADVPQLYLETPEQTVDVVNGRRLVELIAASQHQPTVAMLCSCQSATRGNELWSDDDGQLSALGPRLAEAGVAGVVAMQGNVTMETASEFAPAFFKDLADHGVLDRAMAAARRVIERRRDWWVPVLYSRLRSGRTYYRPEFAERADVTWADLSLHIKSKELTPVLGPGLADEILGSRQDIARRLVARWQMPLAPHSQGDLAQVAQFLRVRAAPGTVRAQLLEHLDTEIEKRRETAAPGTPFYDLDFDPDKPEDAIVEAGRRFRASNGQDDPYTIAAALPVTVYVTTAWTDLLQDALRSRGREPVTMSFAWHRPTDPDALDGFEVPTVERPLVYHTYGRLEDRRSLVMTEDDYFAWYSAWLRRRGKEVPQVVKSALVQNALLFLGFQLDDWDFRVIFHGIKSFEGSALLRENKHVGVQLSPDNQLIEPEMAQEYLESYFGVDNVNIFWGETKQFLTDLRDRAELLT
jgi:hypothetical protein